VKENRAVVYYDSECHLCKFAHNVISKENLDHRFLSMSKYSAENAVILVDCHGDIHRGFDALFKISTMDRRLIPFIPLLYFLSVTPIGRSFYRLIANSRKDRKLQSIFNYINKIFFSNL
jgi:predicted DCC family thiol-disulfide oxidoreductase YuxK